MKNKIKSFTLSELLVVMVITAIVVSIAFTVLRLVQKQVHAIQENFRKTSELSLFEQRLWQDFNAPGSMQFDRDKNILLLESETDTVNYAFHDDFVLRDNDTLQLKLNIANTYLMGKKNGGVIDAMAISAERQLPGYKIFIFRKNDATLPMNQDGL